MRRVSRSELLEHLSRGVEHWNRWRSEPVNRTIWPDLIELRREDLPSDNLRGINLQNTNLLRANFRHCCLADADLRTCNLKDACLVDADLQRADLREANLHSADLCGADLRSTQLHHANLSRTNLEGTRFDRAVLLSTSLDNTSLARSRGFERVFMHREAPITIGFDTLQRTLLELRHQPERLRLFYRLFSNFGVPPEVLNLYVPSESRPILSRQPFLRRLISRLGIDLPGLRKESWRSCFLSYSHQDTVFASRLDAELTGKNVPVYYAPRSSRISAAIEEEIETSIALADRVIVVCSQSALNSEWVGREVDLALAKAEAIEEDVLIPLDLDGRVHSSLKTHARQLRRRVVADFRDWQIDPDKYSRSLDRLIDTLQHSPR